MTQKLRGCLVSQNLLIRLASLWLSGLLLNTIAWSIGYAFLPQGVLQGIFAGSSLIPTRTTLVSILLYNIGIASGLIFCANLFRIRWFPLGYLPVLFHWMLFGLFLGTNSFELAVGAKIATSFLHLFGSVGFIEISAYTLLAAASLNLYIYRQDSLFRLHGEKVRDWSQIRLVGGEYLLIGVAYLLIIWAAYRESISIFLKGLLQPVQSERYFVRLPLRSHAREGNHTGPGMIALTG